MNLSREQLTVIALAALLAVGSMAVSPAMVFGPPDTSDAKTGEIYTTSGNTNRVPSGSYDAASMMAVPDGYTSTTTPDTSAPPEVSASAGAQTMSVTVTERGGDVALQLADDRVHEGRWVSIPSQWFETELGGVPEVAYITHESGTEYQAPMHAQGGDVAFYVRGFSTNTVTFSGSVEVTGNYTDGASAQYDLASLDSVSDPVVDLTGITTTETESETGTRVSTGSTHPIAIGGNAPPTGPSANGEPTLTVSVGPGDYNPVTNEGDGTTDAAMLAFGDSSANDNIAAEMKVQPSQNRTVSNLSINVASVTGSDYGAYLDVFIVQESSPDSTYVEGTQVLNDYSGVEWATGPQTIPFDSSYQMEGGKSYTIQFITNTDDGDSSADHLAIGGDNAASSVWFSNDQNGDQQRYPDVTLEGADPVSSLDVSDGAGHSVSVGSVSTGSTTTVEFANLTASSSELNFSGSGGPIDYNLTVTERTRSADPGVELNGNWLNHTGTLADGDTVSLTGNSSWLQEGTNRLNVTVGDGTLSSDAPTPMVGVNLTHDATDKHSVDYDGGQWSEAYNVSETYASSRTQANLTVPFQVDVYAIQSIEAEINGSGWTSVSSSNYNLDNTTLTVDLDGVYGGDIPAGTKMAVRTTGIAVDPVNASITVTKTTTPGQALNSTLQLDSWGTDAYLDVSGTPRGDRIHYTSNETWDADEYSDFGNTGTQTLHLPAASAGDSLRVHTLPLQIAIQSGDVHTRVPDSRVNRTQPVYKVEPGETVGDAYDVTFVDAVDGEDYILWSETHGIVLDSGTASSPLTLTDDEDDVELIQFLLDTGTSSSSSTSGSGGGGVTALPTTGGDSNFVPLIGVAIVGGLVLVAARNDGAVADAGEDAAAGIESTLARVPVAGPVVGKTIGGGVETVTQLAEGIAGNQTVALSIVTALIIGAIQGGIIEVPQSSLTLIVVAGIGIYSLVALREFGEFTTERWAAILAATTVVTLQTLSEASLLTAIVESDVWPILALAGVLLAYRFIQGIRQPDSQTNIVVQGQPQNDDEGNQ